jgi:hypothetical protein
MLRRNRKLIALAIGMAIGALTGSAGLNKLRADDSGTYKWEDANHACPTTCDSTKYACPCWQAY